MGEGGERMSKPIIDPEITVKVNARELTRKLNQLDFTKMSVVDVKEYIREHITVSSIGSKGDIRLYLDLKE